MNTIQFDLGGGASIALPADTVAQRLIERLQDQSRISAPRLKIGEHLSSHGGTYAGDILGDDGTVYGLIASDADLGPFEWGRYGTDVPGAASTWDGLSNTNALRNNGHPAAQAASDHDARGRSDWYLPSKRELQIAQANVPSLFEMARYWTSTQYSANYAWAVGFEDGSVDGWLESGGFRVRPFRRFTY